MDTAETWQFLIDELPEAWAFAAPDWRGFGKTQAPQGEYWFADYLADLDMLLDMLSPDRPARVIAHSMGANVAMLYAGVRIGRLEWLVNLEGVGLAPTHPAEAPDRYLHWLDELRTPPRAARHDRTEAIAAGLLRRNPRLPAARARWLAAAHSADPRHRRINPVLYRREEAEACWARIAIPVLLILGGRSEARTLAAQGLKATRVVTIPEAGHSMHLEDPAATARAIADFLAPRSARD